MKRTLLALAFATFTVACPESAEDSDTDVGTDADTGADSEVDTEGDTEADTEADTEVMASCDDPVIGGAVGGDLLNVDDDSVVADVLATDRCTVTARDLTYDTSNTIYPALLMYADGVKVAELWIDARVYDGEDIDVMIFEDANGAPLWDGEAVLTVDLADALQPEVVWATVDLGVVD